MNRTKYSLWLNDAERAALDRIRDEDGISTSEQIRQAIRLYLRQRDIDKAAPRRVSPRRKA